MHTSQCLFYTQTQTYTHTHTHVNYLSSSVRCHMVETVPGGFHGNTPEYWRLNKWLLDSDNLLWLNKMFGMHGQSQGCIVWQCNKCDSAIR